MHFWIQCHIFDTTLHRYLTREKNFYSNCDLVISKDFFIKNNISSVLVSIVHRTITSGQLWTALAERWIYSVYLFSNNWSEADFKVLTLNSTSSTRTSAGCLDRWHFRCQPWPNKQCRPAIYRGEGNRVNISVVSLGRSEIEIKTSRSRRTAVWHEGLSTLVKECIRVTRLHECVWAKKDYTVIWHHLCHEASFQPISHFSKIQNIKK